MTSQEYNNLIAERDRLKSWLNQLNVHSTGRDRVIERIEAIGQELHQRWEPP